MVESTLTVIILHLLIFMTSVILKCKSDLVHDIHLHVHRHHFDVQREFESRGDSNSVCSMKNRSVFFPGPLNFSAFIDYSWTKIVCKQFPLLKTTSKVLLAGWVVLMSCMDFYYVESEDGSNP